MKRFFDIALALVLTLPCGIAGIFVSFFIRFSSPGSVLYWSERVGCNNKNFFMPKFRTMRTDTPAVATHLLDSPDDYLIPAGRFLRRTSLDELPQLWSILTGEMSFVGPRPALFNQDDLIALRTKAGIHKLTPGLTGWAQINGRDDLSIEDKVALEKDYLEHRSFFFDLKIIALTVLKTVQSKGISH